MQLPLIIINKKEQSILGDWSLCRIKEKTVNPVPSFANIIIALLWGPINLAASLSSHFPSCFLRDHHLMPKGTSSCHLLCVFFVTGTILGSFSFVPYFLLRKSSASPTSISRSKEQHRMDTSGPSMLGCSLRMTRDEIKVEATYHSLYGFLSPLNVPLGVQTGHTKKDFTVERSVEQLDSEGQTRWKEAEALRSKHLPGQEPSLPQA